MIDEETKKEKTSEFFQREDSTFAADPVGNEVSDGAKKQIVSAGIKKEYLLIILPLVALAAAAYFWFSYNKKEGQPVPTPQTESLVKKSSSAARGTLPNFGETLSNPLEKMPNVNPVEQANPFTKIKTNPFK